MMVWLSLEATSIEYTFTCQGQDAGATGSLDSFSQKVCFGPRNDHLGSLFPF
ncbi:MAG: hypothetical protein IPG18_01455 [Saprospiraceae bacterium]|nr:hypothetical protein [Saprospiraceae bacterium]